MAVSANFRSKSTNKDLSTSGTEARRTLLAPRAAGSQALSPSKSLAQGGADITWTQESSMSDRTKTNSLPVGSHRAKKVRSKVDRSLSLYTMTAES
jgi:hypothetical protein